MAGAGSDAWIVASFAPVHRNTEPLASAPIMAGTATDNPLPPPTALKVMFAWPLMPMARIATTLGGGSGPASGDSGTGTPEEPSARDHPSARSVATVMPPEPPNDVAAATMGPGKSTGGLAGDTLI